VTDNGRPAVINDRYELSKRIGRGGMADVFLARDLLLDRLVAIKVLFPEFATDPNFVERFRREAQAAANLSHPNVVSVYDWGKHSGTYFIAMEYVEGRSLADILRSNGHVTSKQAAEIASEVAAALGFAHQAGLVHRDIKPANILIGSNGQVKVADFGIARAMNAAAESHLTQAGAVMGTATYFSPEQAQGAQPDPRSDLYSVGVVMYEMVAGRPPFTGANPVSIAYKQVHDAPQPLNQLVADVPRAYEAIVAKLLAKDPKLRYTTAEALRDDLRRFRNGDQVMALAAATAAAGIAGRTAATPTVVSPVTGTAATPTVATPRTAASSHLPTGSSPAARYYEQPPSRTGWYALAAFLALVALGIGGLLLFQTLSGDDEASALTLPDYTNRPLEEVTADLESRGLNYQVFDERNTTVPVGFVHRTEPPAGTVVTEDEVIDLYFNPDPQLQPVPNVAGRSLEDARRILSAAGFQIGEETTEESEEVDEGLVIRTDPAANEQVEQGTAIDIVYSAGRRQIAIPNVAGQDEATARRLLESPPYEFEVTTVTQDNEAIAAGDVIGTDPESGSLIDVGGSIQLLVSSGPPAIDVPDVVGDTEADARNQLSAAGFQVNVTFEDVPFDDPSDGRVRSQSVAGGTRAPQGTTIDLVVGRAVAPPVTTVPPTEPPTTIPATTTPSTTT
jgi:serine/threonine-protein kinase